MKRRWTREHRLKAMISRLDSAVELYSATGDRRHAEQCREGAQRYRSELERVKAEARELRAG